MQLFTLTIESRLDSVPALATMARKVGESAGLSSQEQDEVELCITEAANNVIKHAYLSDPTNLVELTATILPDCIVFDLFDSGISALPSSIETDRRHLLDLVPDADGPAESGRGIAIIQSIMDSLKYIPGQRNHLRLTKRLQRIGLRILVAEDNRVNQAVALRVLEKMGHTPVIVISGKAAVEMVRAQHFDIVLMDIQMPEMDGLTATRLIRQSEQLTGDHIPIIAVTACATQENQESCLAAGMDGYVTKPIRTKEITDTIAQLVTTIGKNHDSNVNPGAQTADTCRPRCSDHTEVADLTSALKLTGGDTALLEQLCTIFLTETPKLLSEIREAINQRDPSKLQRAAHALKGSSSVFSHARVSDAALALETLGAESTFDGAQQAFTELIEAIAELENSMLKKAWLR